MKREIPPAVAILIIVVVLVVAGFFYARHWFSGPKEISGTPPPEVNLAPPGHLSQTPMMPPSQRGAGQPQAPMTPPPPPGYGR